MPLHAQIILIGGNAVVFAILLIAFFAAPETGVRVFIAGMAGVVAYSVWILLKFRRYLSAEQSMERELHIEQLREEIDKLKANNAPDEPVDPTRLH